jgi:hypothetical protein
MLEDFVPKEGSNDKLRDGDVIQPSPVKSSPEQTTEQVNADVSTPPVAPSGPYRPQILKQPPTKEQLQATSVEQNQEVPKDTKDDTKGQPNMPKKPKSKIKKIFIALLVIVLVGGLGFVGWWFGLRDTGIKSVARNNTTGTPKLNDQTSKLTSAPLSGLDVDTDTAARPVTAIMIENSEEARPQSGLNDADVVFEAIAEGGITRFLALYQSKAPEYVGPVRSARPYYVEWAKTFDASYVHAGGSPDGMQAISSLGVKDVSAFAYGEDVFFRTKDRQSPHNLYTSFKGLDKVNKDKGFTSSKFTPWSRKNDVAQTPTAKKIDLSISSDYYNPSYTYDSATNTYLRNEGGEVHKDEKSGKQLAPKTVLALILPRSQSGIYSVYRTTGTGKFIAFQDGIATEGTWTKASTSDQYSFKDALGFDFLFNKGQTWVSVVSDLKDITYAP